MINRTTRRFQEMKNLHSRYFSFYREHILSAQKNIKDLSIRKMLVDFVIGKIGFQAGVRAYIFNVMWKLLGLIESETLFYLCAGVEMQLGQTYSYNVGADGKAGYSHVNNKKIAFGTADQMLKIHKDFIYKTPKINFSQKRKIWNIFEKIYKNFYIGQVFDVIINLYPNLNRSINDILKLTGKGNFYNKFGFSEVYKNRIYQLLKNKNFDINNLEYFLWQRTYGINANMIEYYPYIIKVIDPKISNEKVLNLSKYGRYYGLAMMIINDIQDFFLDLPGKKFPTREKKKEDVFNDIRNQKITWPIFYGLSSWNQETIRKIREIYKNPSNIDLQKEFKNFLVRNGLIERSLLEAASYASISTDYLKIFMKSNLRENLEDTSISICKNSKYIKAISEKYGVKIKASDSLIKMRKKFLRQYLQNNSDVLLMPFNNFLIDVNKQIL